MGINAYMKICTGNMNLNFVLLSLLFRLILHLFQTYRCRNRKEIDNEGRLYNNLL